jgi:hypothetical protein
MIDNLSWVTAYPEILLLVMACVIALVDLGVKTPTRTVTYVLSLLTLAAVALLQGLYASTGATVYSFGNMVVSDPMGNWLKCFAAIAMMATLVYGRPYAADRDMLRGGELFTLSLFSLLGMFVMISGNNFLVLYLGLELLTLSSYALVALRRDNGVATEAAMKYFVLGALASGFLLLWPVDALRCHRLVGHQHCVPGGGIGPGQAPSAGLGPGVRGLRPGVQAGRGAFPHVDSRCLPGCAYSGHSADWRCAQAGRFRHGHASFGGRVAALGHRLAADADGALGGLAAGG